MFNILEKLNKLSEKRIKYFESWNDDKWFYNGSKTYFKELPLEIEEAFVENKINNSVYLEDELWDILWDYLCLLNTLKIEWKISSIENVFKRSYKKFSWRINEKTWKNNWDWKEIKKLQKEELKKENDLIF